MAEQQYDDQKDNLTICDTISNLENYYADVVLSDELKEIYAQVQLECNDFRNNIFFRNLEYLEDKLGYFDKSMISHTIDTSAIDKLIKDVKMPSKLLQFYAKKAEKII